MRIIFSFLTSLVGLIFGFIIRAHQLFEIPNGKRLAAYKYILGVLGDNLSIALFALLGMAVVFVFSWFLIYTNVPVGLPQKDFAGQKYRRSLRGSRMTTPFKLKKKTAAKKPPYPQITVGDIPMPIDAEVTHLLLVGATGTGKSVTIKEIMNGVIERNKKKSRGIDKLFVVDPNGDLLSHFYEKGDYILNPHDKRTEGWSFFNEIRHNYDFERFTWSLVPASSGEQETWNGYARLLLESVLQKMYEQGNYSMLDVYDMCTIKPLPELKLFLEDTKGYAIVAGDEGETPTIRSTRFVLTKYLSKHVEMPMGDFSIREWLEDGKANKLFITWREDLSSQMKPLISAWTDIMFSSVLSFTPGDSGQRLWALLDELPSLDYLTNLEAATTKGRKHGIRVVAGIQSTAQLDDIYGKDKAQTLRASFRSMLALGGAKTDSKTAEAVSQNLGEHEVLRTKKNRSGGKTGESESKERERIVLPSEITNLPPLTGFLSFAGDYPIARVKVTPRKLPRVEKGFVEKINTLPPKQPKFTEF